MSILDFLHISGFLQKPPSGSSCGARRHMCVSPIFLGSLEPPGGHAQPPGDASCFGQILIRGEFCGICDFENNYV